MRLAWKQLHFPSPYDASEALGFAQRLAADERRGPVVFEARSEDGSIRHLVGASDATLSGVEKLFRHLVPDAIVADPAGLRVAVERAGRVRIRQRNLGLSLDTNGAALRALFAALSYANEAGDVIVLQVILGASVPPQPAPDRPQDPNLSLFDLVTSGTRPAPADVRADLRSKLGQYRFRATVRVGVSSGSPTRRRLLVHGMLAALRQLQTGSTRIDLVSDRPDLVDAATIPARKPLRLTADEALCLLGWPTGEKALPGMPPAHPRRLTPPRDLAPATERSFAVTTSAGPALPVGISMADALRHTHVVGPTGVGKSTVLLSLIAADVTANRSVVVIDPKRDLAMDVLSVIPEHRAGDVVVLDPTSPNPVGFNPFAGAGDRAPLVADRLVSVFRGLFPSAFGPRTSDAVHASLLTLAAHPGATLADLPRLLTDARFRRTVTADIDDPTLAGFWAGFEQLSPGAQSAMIGPVLTRLRQFLLRPSVRAVLDQPVPRFDLRDLFEKPRVLVVTLNRGLLGPTSAELLGSLVVSQLWQLILARAETPRKERTPVSIYLDEAQMFVGHDDELGEALEQSRSLGAAWHLAHQHRGQLTPALLAGISANARNKIQFQADPADAAAVSRHSALTPDDLTKLPPFHAYVDLLADGAQTGWFSVVTKPGPSAISDPLQIIAESRARYGRLDDPTSSSILGRPDAPQNGGDLAPMPPRSTSAAEPSENVDEPVGRRRKERP